MKIGKTKEEMGELTMGHEVRIAPPGIPYFKGHETRTTRIDGEGNEWVRIKKKYYRYPEQIQNRSSGEIKKELVEKVKKVLEMEIKDSLTDSYDEGYNEGLSLAVVVLDLIRDRIIDDKKCEMDFIKELIEAEED